MALAAMRGALEGRGIVPRIVFLEARDDVLIRRYSETRHRHPLGDGRGIATSIADERRIARPDPDRGRRRRRHVGPVAPRAARAAVLAARDDTRPDQLADPAHQLRLQVRRPARGRPRVRRPVHARTRTTCRSCASSSGLTDAVRAFVLEQPVTTRFLELVARIPRLRHPRVHRRGQDPADDRDRLHRRLPPLDRHRRGAGHLAARARTSARSRSSTASSTGPDRGSGPRGMNLRRWLTPGIGVKRWLLVVFIGLSLLALAAAHVLRQVDPGPRAGRARPGR